MRLAVGGGNRELRALRDPALMQARDQIARQERTICSSTSKMTSTPDG